MFFVVEPKQITRSSRILGTESGCVNKRTVLVILILSMFIAAGVDAREHDPTLLPQVLAAHDVVIDAVSWRSFPITCVAGDTLSGEFSIVSNGDLFPGDQTKYDNWLLGGIDFLILDKVNYDLWVNESVATPLFEGHSLVKLAWSIEIPYNGVWHVVYSNDSIFMKQVEGSIIRSGPNDFLIQLIGLIGAASSLTLLLIYWKKK